MNPLRRIAVLIAAALAFSTTAPAYYYYTHFTSRYGPTIPVPERFDLSSLPNRTIPFFVSDQGASQYAPGESFPALLSQIRSAAKVWNDVDTSDLRIAYGGLYASPPSQSAPAINVDFSDDISPGVLALGGVDLRTDLAAGANGPFVPVVHSRVLVRRDLSQTPTYTEAFFLTMVHEFGHTLGLQHTLTSSVMATGVTRSTTKARPLAADDVAGISLLYPAAKYSGTWGTIMGRVTQGGAGVNLASVVALSANGQGISAFSNPDGTYRIDGLPAGQYYVYAHPLPPPLQGEVSNANVVYPLDANGNPVGPGSPFETQFYPGTRDWTRAVQVFVNSSAPTSGIDFNVQRRSSVPVHSVRAYGYVNGNAVPSAPLISGVARTTMVANGAGVLQQNALTPGLNLGVLGTGAELLSGSVRPYTSGYIQMDLRVSSVNGDGPRHLLFSTPGDLYVLPSAFNVVYTPPPAITSVSPTTDSNGNRAVLVSGTNLSSDTRVWFDGVPGALQGVQSDGRLLVTPPFAPGAYRAVVTALNPDGQSSLFTQATSPVTYIYDPADSPALSVTPLNLASGSDTQVDVTGVNTNFVDGQTTVGFGSSDVVVKKVTVLSPTHLVATVTSNGAAAQTSSINITTGLQVISQTLGTSIAAQASAR